MAITIEGLSYRQRAFADIMWKCQSREQVLGFIRSLPAEFRNEARTVLEMLLAATFDELTDTTEATDLLNHIRKI